jgi:hypothetical protein
MNGLVRLRKGESEDSNLPHICLSKPSSLHVSMENDKSERKLRFGLVLERKVLFLLFLSSILATLQLQGISVI